MKWIEYKLQMLSSQLLMDRLDLSIDHIETTEYYLYSSMHEERSFWHFAVGRKSQYSIQIVAQSAGI